MLYLIGAFFAFFEIVIFFVTRGNFVANYVQAPFLIQMGVYLVVYGGLICIYLLLLFIIKRKVKILYFLYTFFIAFAVSLQFISESYKPKDTANWITFILAIIVGGIILYFIRSFTIVGLAEAIFDDIYESKEDLWLFGLFQHHKLEMYDDFIESESTYKKESSHENNYKKNNLPNIMEYMHEWNSIEDIPKIVIIESGTDSYYKLNKLEDKFGKDNLITAIRKINKSRFLKGYETSFIITFEWFLEEKNFVKVLSGRYTDRRKTYNKSYNSNSSKEDKQEKTKESSNNSFEEKYVNYCEMLGVDVDCEESELKRKYMQLSKVYHPDQNKNKNSQKKFVEITEAYEFIRDNQERYMRDFVQNEQNVN